MYSKDSIPMVSKYSVLDKKKVLASQKYEFVKKMVSG
jgi:hypothetical protein